MQKDWFAQQVMKEFDKTGGIDYIKKLSQNKFINRYKIAPSTARTWISKYKNPKKINHGPHGRQRKLADDKFLMMAMKEVSEGTVVTTGKGKGKKDKHVRMTEQEVKVCLAKHHQLMLQSQGKRVHEDEGTLCDRVYKKLYKRKIELSDGKIMSFQGGAGQVQTEARLSALRDPRMAVQQAVSVEAYFGDKPDSNKWNADGATTYHGPLGKGAKMVRIVVKDKEEAHNIENEFRIVDKDPLSSSRFQDDLGIFVKWMHLQNAAGNFGSITLIVKVPKMPEGAYLITRVVGLTNTSDSRRVGQIIWASSRCMKGPKGAEADDMLPNGKSVFGWNQYLTDVLCVDIQEQSDFHNLRDESGVRIPHACMIDGEMVVAREILSTRVSTVMKSVGLSMVKGRPSCTRMDNYADQSDNFRDLRTGLRVLSEKLIDTSNAILASNIIKSLGELHTDFSTVPLPAPWKKKVIDAILGLTYVLQNGGYVTPGKARIGAIRAGAALDPRQPRTRTVLGRESSTIDFEKIIRKLCYADITAEQYEHILENAPEMIRLNIQHGRLEARTMDRLGIVKLADDQYKNRDELTLCQQGPVDLTHDETVEREAATELRKRNFKKNKIIADKLAKAQKLLDKQQVTEAARANKQREKARVDAMTTTERKEHKAAITKANKKKKELTEKKAAKALERAARIIAGETDVSDGEEELEEEVEDQEEED